ncbi:dipeptidase [Ammoniphilus oxalaticus]|uniref:Dipeptidase n=1 Tax=Ammoniphilus oxalaticus TaxID=66863 RepID=A0A419SJU0_9BACL|nr:dipeptidase [Ammoniphilus oxalaticus]RKD24301.1 dipeptidase [Ammoniphilus oxalaticus]
MKIIDAHCDTLMKMTQNESLSFYRGDEQLQTQFDYMERSDVILQVFALYTPPSIPISARFQFTLKMIDAFYERIVKPGKIAPIYSTDDIDRLFESSTRHRGGMLSLEGAEALQGELVNLRILHRLGLRALGFTWNHRNEAADGVEEPNPSGLSQFGRSLLREANRLGILLDVSHLSEKGFWDVIERSEAPILASHSNCKKVYDHQRNLTDEQLRAIISKQGVIGLTFVPQFIHRRARVKIKDLLAHVDHVLSIGGENHLAFGSDFDGISRTMSDLEHTGYYYLVVNELVKRYPEEQVKKWLHGNWRRLFSTVLP